MTKSDHQKQKGKGKKMLLIGLKFKHEIARIFKSRGNVIFFIIFTLLGIFLVYSGIAEYKNFQEEKALSMITGKNSVDLDVTYSQYGDHGFHVLYEPSPLSLFFTHSSVFENLHSHVDLTGSLKVNTSFKERNPVQRKRLFKDLAGLFFLLGSLFMVYMGMTAVESEKIFFRFGNLLLRLVILVIFFLGLAAVLQCLPILSAVQFSPRASKLYLYFVFFLLCFLSFFYAGGLFIRTVLRKKRYAYVYSLLFWFFSVSVVPECMMFFLQNKSPLPAANQKYNLMTPKEVMNFEKKLREAIVAINTVEERDKIYQNMVRDFLDTGSRKNTKIEEDINNNIKKIMSDYESVMRLYPTSFFYFFCGELSSKGYGGYVDLVSYTLQLRHEFIQYYLKKGDDPHEKNIIPSVRTGKNIFKASSRLPRSFLVGAGLTLALTVILFFTSYLLFLRRSRPITSVKKPQYRFRRGYTYFVLCENEQFQDALFDYYRAKKDNICLEEINADDVDTAVGLNHMISYFCKITGVKEEAALKNLRRMGIGDPKNRKWNKEKLSEEIVQKVYCAVSMAGDQKMIVVKDFLKGKSRKLELQFLRLANDSRKIVLYLSTEIFLTLLPLQGEIKIDGYKNFKIDPLAVSLR